MPRLYKHTSNKALLSDKFSAERDVVAVEEALGSAAFPKGLRRLLLRLARCLPSVSTPPWPCRQFRTGIGQALRRAAAQIVKATGSDRDSSQAKPSQAKPSRSSFFTEAVRRNSRHSARSRSGSMSFGVEPPAGHSAVSRGPLRPRAALLLALRTRSRAGEARRSVPLRASERPIRSGAWGWLRLFAASSRARPAARTSPPSGAGPGVGAPEGLSRGIRRTGGGSTRNDLNPPFVRRVRFGI
jgi:hypothetical protein